MSTIGIGCADVPFSRAFFHKNNPIKEPGNGQVNRSHLYISAVAYIDLYLLFKHFCLTISLLLRAREAGGDVGVFWHADKHLTRTPPPLLTQHGAVSTAIISGATVRG